MFSNQKRYTSEDEDHVVAASTPSNKENISMIDTTDSKSAMFRGFSLPTKNSQKGTGLRISSPPSTSFSNFKNLQFNSNPLDSLFYTNVYTKFDDRIPTFYTWPKSHPINPEAIARAGFIYSGHGDKVICPWCKIKLIDWECFDIPMDEHRKHSPNCQFMLMLFPKI